MKTSKKILSFFLAVVMVITTCSIGFTAFAAENNKSIWKTSNVDAEAAFDTLNELADLLPPVLMGIDAIANFVYEKHAKELGKTADALTDSEKKDIADNATFQDILGGLQPTLIEALAGVKQSEFVTDYLEEPASKVSQYSYLDSDNTVSFYTLFALCTQYMEDDRLSDESRETLQKWFLGPEPGENGYSDDSLLKLAMLLNEQNESESSRSQKVEDVAAKFSAKDAKSGETVDYSKASLYDLKHFDFSPYIDEETQEVADGLMAQYNKFYQAYGWTGEMKDFADLIYYQYGYGQKLIEVSMYINLAEKGGKPVVLNGEYKTDGDMMPLEAEDINTTNFLDKMAAAFLKTVEAPSWDAFTAAFETAPSGEQLRSRFDNDFLDTYINSVIPNNGDIEDSPYYIPMLKGLAVEYLDMSLSDVNALISKRMPAGFGEADCIIDDATLASFANMIGSTSNNPRVDAVNLFNEGSATYVDAYSRDTVTAELPDVLKDTATSEYLALVAAQDPNGDHSKSIFRAFMGTECFDRFILAGEVKDNNAPFLKDENGFIIFRNVSPQIGSKTGYDENGNLETNTINGLIAESQYYETIRVIADLFDYTNLSYNSVTKLSGNKIEIRDLVADEAAASADFSSGVVLTEEQKDLLNGTGKYADRYDLTGELGTEIVNCMLNTTVADFIKDPLLGDQSIEDIVNSLLVTRVSLQDIVTDIWSDLMKSPVETLVNLLPALVVLLDELIEPFIFNEGKSADYAGDQWNTTIYKLLGGLIPVVAEYYTENGSNIGISQIGWDLNTLLPNVMHWLLGDKDYEGITYYNNGVDTDVVVKTQPDDSTDWVTKLTPASDVASLNFDAYKVTDTDGNTLTFKDGKFTYLGQSFDTAAALAKEFKDAQFQCTMTYKGNVPYLTGIYIADLALRDAKISDIAGLIDGNVGKGVCEAVTEIATLFTEALEEFVNTPEYRNDTKYAVDGNRVGRGLNNLFVALPRLFDIMENLAADKYGVDENAWTYCFEGKIVANKDHEDQSNNAVLEEFKSYAASPNSVEIFDCFAEIFVENWLNAIFSLLNNVISTDNEIANNLPIVAGLLNALGGLGEESIITDILNSVFQITRDSDYSFEFNADYKNSIGENKFVGLKKDHAYFLIANVNRLVEVVMNLISDFGGNNDSKSASSSTSNNNSTRSASNNSPVYTPGKTTNAKASSAKYSSSDLSNAKDLIKNLDSMLSSLLSDSTLNDFSLDSTENILSGLTSFADRYLSDDVNVNNDTATDILYLINKYLYYITGEEKNVVAKNNDVNPKTTYSNNALTGLVVETYALIERIADSLLDKQFTNNYDNNTLKYNLLIEAIDGIIAPDAVSVRLSDYPDAQKKFAETKYTSWTQISEASSRNNYKSLKVNWGFKDGDKEGFYDGLSASLRLVSSILGVLLVDTGWYQSVITPVLGAFCDKNGIKMTSYKTLVDSKNKTGYYDETLKAVISPIAQWIDALLAAPASTLIKSIQGLAGVLDDKNTKAGTIKSIINGAITPIQNELKGAGKIFGIKSDKLLATSPTLQKTLNNLASSLSDTIWNALKLGNGNNKYTLSGSNLIPIINSYIASTGITLKQISWSKIYSSTPEAAVVYVLEYVIETLLDNKNLAALAGLINSDVVTILVDAIQASKIDAKGILSILNRILEATDSPTLAYWTFAQYLQEKVEKFKYPVGMTKAMADQGVTTLDSIVENIFPLLGSFGVNLGADDLKGIIDKNLFKNDFVTQLAVALYGALDGLDPTVKDILKGLGIVTSTKDVAKLLTDKSYGATYSSAANTIKAQSSWKNVKNVNWGFTDGSAKAQQGFVNALVAVLRPLNNVLQIFLNEGTLQLNGLVSDLINSITVAQTTTELKITDGMVAKITYSMKNGVLTLKVKDANRARSATSTLKLDLRSLKNLNDLKIEGTNGYNSAIIPLLEAFKCSDVKTYKQYQKDVKNAKDNLLLDILNPIVGASKNSLLNKLADKPFDTLTELLPNIAMYLDSHGLSQLLNNLLAPVTDLIADIAKTLNINEVMDELLGMSLGDLVSLLLDVEVDLDLTDLSKLNIEDLVIPIVRLVLAGNSNESIANLKLYDIDWNALISLGTKATYTSKATGANGKYLTGKTLNNVDNGKVLITVLRYILKTLTANMSTIKNLLLGIDAIKKSDVLTSVISSVLNTIGTASPDQLITAIYYLVAGQPRNAFWDYSSYKTGNYEFSYPSTVDVDFLKNLPPMLDGLIGGLLNLNDLVNKNLFTDSLVSKLATGLYGAIDGVKINDNTTLTSLLAQTDIDFSTANVANLLVDEAYGQSYESAASVIRAAGSWKNVNADSLKWGVTDRDSFFHALVAVLRPIYGVLDVLVNDAYLGLFDMVRIPGSNGYSSSIVPVLEAFSCYNIKTQYQYRQDINKEYDAILLDIINPLWDKVEDLLNAPLQTLTSMVPNLALFIGNDGLCQIIDNLLAPISALADSIRPIVDLNDLLDTLFKALNVDLNSILSKIGVTNFSLDVYNLGDTLKPILSGDAIVPLLNSVLGLIKIGGNPLGLKLNAIDWLQLASHGKTIVSASQAATYGSRIFVEGDSSETLIAVLRYLIETVNAGDNFSKISGLIGGLLGDSVDDSISDVINNVLEILQGDTDEVISELVNLLQTLA
ncbi:MAG: hypothetical protein NC397_04320 [Clostridium sp.]|nr:hypothetical protein [Clostridium sp.]